MRDASELCVANLFLMMVLCHLLMKFPVFMEPKFFFHYCVHLDRIPVGTRFSARLYRPWGPPSLLYSGYWVLPGGKVRPGRAADHLPPSSAAVMEE